MTGLTKNSFSSRFDVKNLILFLVAVSILFRFIGCALQNNWRTASNESAKLLPDAQTTREAILAVLGADVWGWRGRFAIHTWIAVKKAGADQYTVYDVVGWRSHYEEQVFGIRQDIPDRYWYGNKPRIIKQKTGKGVDDLIEKIDKAAKAYPWKTTYNAFPGPNSNTFTAWVGLKVPELELKLPSSAIGSDYARKAIK